MNRKMGLLVVAVSTLSVWLFATSGCSGGGSDSSPSPEVGESAPDAVDTVDADGVASTTDAVTRAPDDGTVPGSPFGAPGSDGPTAAPTPPVAVPSDDDSSPPAAPSASDDGPALQRPIGDGTDTTAIAGLWDYTRDTGSGIDIVLFAIDATGGLTEYDFQNDAAGNGADCHLVQTFAIASSGNDRYDIQDASTLPGADSIDDVLITADDASITFRYLGVASDPQFGGSQSGVSATLPAATAAIDSLIVCEG